MHVFITIYCTHEPPVQPNLRSSGLELFSLDYIVHKYTCLGLLASDPYKTFLNKTWHFNLFLFLSMHKITFFLFSAEM